MNYLKFLYLTIIFTGFAFGEVWDNSLSSQEKYLNQNASFEKKFDKITRKVS